MPTRWHGELRMVSPDLDLLLVLARACGGLLVRLGLGALSGGSLGRGGAGRFVGAAGHASRRAMLRAVGIVAALRNGLALHRGHRGARAHRLRVLVALRRRVGGPIQRAFPVARAGLRVDLAARALALDARASFANAGAAARAFVGPSAGHSVRVPALDARGGRAGALVTARGRPARPSLRSVGGAVRLGGRRRRSALRIVVLRRGLVLGRNGGQRADERADEKRVHAGKLGTLNSATSA